MEVLIHPTINSETSDSFTVEEPTTVIADFMAVGEVCFIERLGPSGDYKILTDKTGPVVLSYRQRGLRCERGF
jgi:hypothetical protein